jgi:tetratricopeptide (TPR) repeat protein
VDTFRQGFSLLDPDKAARVRDQVERLRRRPLTEPALTLLLAELYLGYGLRSEAVEMLEFLPGGNQVAAIQQLLGETYLTMGLFAEAETAFERALAQAAGLPEAEAAAHFGLGQAACGQWKGARAQEQLHEAQAQYQALEMAAQADEMAKWLEKAAENCSKGGTANE